MISTSPSQPESQRHHSKEVTMDMALIHTVNAFSWPLLIIATILGLWKLTSIMIARRSAQPTADEQTGGPAAALMPRTHPAQAADSSAV